MTRIVADIPHYSCFLLSAYPINLVAWGLVPVFDAHKGLGYIRSQPRGTE